MDMFLRIDGIQGESVLKGHEKWIPLLTANWGVRHDGSGGHGGGGGPARGRMEFRPAEFTAWSSVATPLLFEACASGRIAATATFEALDSGQRPVTLARWDFEEVRVSELGMSGSDGAPHLADSFALSFTRARITTFTQDPRGGATTPTSRGWDLAANRAW